MELLILFIATVVVNNFVFTYFLGTCPFLGVSNRIDTAVSMGLAVTFVLVLTAVSCWLIYYKVLAVTGLEYLKYVCFILVIAALVQLVEMFMRKTTPALYRALGIYLPLITTNCVILGLAVIGLDRKYNFIENLVFGLGIGVGFTMAIAIMAGIREEIQFADVPKHLRGPGITLIIAGCLAMTFMGFTGVI